MKMQQNCTPPIANIPTLMNLKAFEESIKPKKAAQAPTLRSKASIESFNLNGSAGIEFGKAPAPLPNTLPSVSDFQKNIKPSAPQHGNQTTIPEPAISDELRMKHFVTLPPPREDVKVNVEQLVNIPDPKIVEQVRMMVIARKMFFERSLFVKGEECHIVDIEIYSSPDPYTPNHSLFYSRNFITFDSKRRMWITYGKPGLLRGILVLAMKVGDVFINGCEEIVKYIGDKFGTDDMAELQMKIEDIKLISIKRPEEEVWSSPRINLKLPKEAMPFDIYCQMLVKSCRFTYKPEAVTQGKHLLAVAARLRGVPDEKIIKCCDLPEDKLLTWVGHFQRGRNMMVSNFFGERVPAIGNVKIFRPTKSNEVERF